MLLISSVFVAVLGLAAGQFSLLTSLQPPPKPRAILQPPPLPLPSPSTPTLDVAPRRSPPLTGLSVLSPPPLPSPFPTALSLSPRPPPPPPHFRIPHGQFTASPPEVSSGFTGIGFRPDLSKESLSKDEVAPSSESSEDATPTPGIASPTTIRFTVDDVPNFFEPSFFAQRDTSLQKDFRLGRTTASIETSNLSLEEDDEPSTASSADFSSQFLLLTSGRDQTSSTASPSEARLLWEALGDSSSPLPLVSSLEAADAEFKPSFHFPFLFDSTEEPQNEFTLVEERNPRITSFLRPEPPHLLESSSNGFVLKPVMVVTQNSTEVVETQRANILSKTPVPTKVDMSEEVKSSTSAPKTTKPTPTRKTLHFDQEFLSLLRTAAAEKTSKSGSSSSPRPFWLNVPKDASVWRLKGGERASPFTLPKTDTAAASTAGGVFAKSVKSLTSAISTASSETDELLPTSEGTNATSEAEGPTVVAVGEVGEVPHDLDTAHTHVVPTTLSAALKHGVQALSVSAKASGCPKLYGKVELACNVNHDAVANTSMKMMWKKKTFLEGRLEEQIVAEDSDLLLKDARLSLKRHPDAYTLVIKDFRPKDCGTYECEVRAADATAASQVLLFTCL